MSRNSRKERVLQANGLSMGVDGFSHHLLLDPPPDGPGSRWSMIRYEYWYHDTGPGLLEKC